LSAIQALTKLLTYKQGDNQGLSTYLKSFKELRDVVKTQLGVNMFDHYAEQQPEYKKLADDDEQSEFKEKLFDEFMGVLFLLNGDQRKYRSMCHELTGAYARGRDEYPTSLKSAVDMLDTHRFDPGFNKDRKKNSNKDSKKDRNGKTEKSFAQKKGDDPIVCYCCGKKGHRSPDCNWEKKIPKDEWFNKTGKVPKLAQGKPKTHTHNQGEDYSDDEESEADDLTDDDSSVGSSKSTRSRNRRSGKSKSKSRSTGWNACMLDATQLHQAEKNNLKDMFIIDTGSTIGATVTNPDLLTGLRPSKTTLRMQTNAGTKKMNLVGDVIGFGEAWYDPDMLTNIFSFSKMADKH
jgi:hypothetical protein